MTQSSLARQLGLTFQQVQKYETGRNRLSASRLFDAARILDVPIAYFFEGLQLEPRRPPPAADAANFADMLTSSAGIRLVRAFLSIEDRQVRTAISLIAERLAHGDADTDRRRDGPDGHDAMPNQGPC